jgi:hypothetical protein
VLGRGGSAGHLRDRATSHRSCPVPVTSGPTPSPSPLRLRPRPAVDTYDMNFWRTTFARPARLADLLRGHWTIENGLRTGSGISPSSRTPPRSAPATAPPSWRPCGTWSSACSAGQGRSTSPPRPRSTPTPGNPGISLG